MRWPDLTAAGVLAACLAWWTLAPKAVDPAPLRALVRRPDTGAKLDPLALMIARFESTPGLFPAPPSGAEGESPPAGAGALKLEGTASTRYRQAALISVGGATPQWLALGQPTQGLELVELGPGRAVVRTSAGDTVTLDLFPGGPSKGAPPTGAADAGE